MVQEGVQYAEEDFRRRQEAEIRNEASSLIYTTEKTLKDVGDRLDQAARSEIESALAELKRIEANGTADEVRAAVEVLKSASTKMSELLYQTAGTGARGDGASAGGGDGPSSSGRAPGAGAGTSGGGRSGGGAGDDVIDAEFKET